jgi:hypothetical protein
MSKLAVLVLLFSAIIGAALASNKNGFDPKAEEELFRKYSKTANSGLGGIVPGTFERIFIIQYENQPYFLVSRDPAFIKYANMGVLLTNYYAITHPSQPNYIAQSTYQFFHRG